MNFKNNLLALFFAQTCFVPSVHAFEIGIHTHAQRYSQNAQQITSNLKKYGFNSIRSDITWEWVEKKPGSFSLSNAAKKNQDLIDTMANNNHNAMIVLAYGNGNYTPSGYPENEEQIKAFKKYVRYIVSLNKGKVKYYEVWNEWVYKTGIKDRSVNVPSTDIYLELVKQTYETIKEIDPSAIVVSGTINPTNARDVMWFDELLKKGILKYLDGVSLHPYSFMHGNKKLRNPTDNFNDVIEYQNHLARRNNGVNVPIYITEMGVPTYDGEGGVTRLNAAIFPFKYTLLAMSDKNIKGIWWYDYSDDGVQRKNKENNFGFFDHYYHPKSSAVAMYELMKLVQGKDISASIINDNVSVTMRNPSDNSQRIILWNDNKSKLLSSKETAKIYINNDISNPSKKNFINTPNLY